MAIPLAENGITIEVHQSCNATPEQQRRHYHSFFEILCISEGHTHVQIRERTLVGGPGDLLIYYPYESHLETVQPGRFSFMVLRCSEEIQGVRLPFPEPEVVEPVIHLPWPERFQNLFSQMMIEQQMADESSNQLLWSYLLQFTGLLARALRAIGNTSEVVSDNAERISRALMVVHHNLDAELTIQALAGHSFMSPSHFCHTFKHIIGSSPKQYVIQTRISKAQELLATSDLSVKAIAAAVGYTDPHRFTRIFRGLTGMTPTAFRENRKK